MAKMAKSKQPANKQPAQGKNADSAPAHDADLQGEGNYDATRRYNAATERFVQSGKVDEAARNAAPRSTAEAEEMKKAERVGLSRVKGVMVFDAVAAADAAELAMQADADGSRKKAGDSASAKR